MTKHFKTVRSIGGRRLVVTPVFDTYWRFASARQELFFRRLAGDEPPWTDDPILSRHRFTNVFRASDRVSQYLIRHVIYEGEQAAEEVIFRTLLFKLFNRIETWELLRSALGELRWRSFSYDRFSRVLDAHFRNGNRLYTAAYIMPSPQFGERRKHRNHLLLIEHMMRGGLVERVVGAKSLESVFEELRSYPSIGDFLAFQLAIDLNYSDVIDFSEMDFVVAGPGALRGIAKCFLDTGGRSPTQIIRLMAEISGGEFHRLGLAPVTLWGRGPQLIDCQNLFCEVDKYARVAHPQFASARTRIKQQYRPDPRPLPQWYPPKWSLSPGGYSTDAAERERAVRLFSPARR